MCKVTFPGSMIINGGFSHETLDICSYDPECAAHRSQSFCCSHFDSGFQPSHKMIQPRGEARFISSQDVQNYLFLFFKASLSALSLVSMFQCTKLLLNI